MQLRLEPAPRWHREMTWFAVAVLAWFTLMAAALVLEMQGVQGPGLCLFRRVTGVPCFTCGGTRAAADWLHGHWGRAIARNPLLFVLELSLIVWLVLRFGFARRLSVQMQPLERYGVWAFLALAVIANWALVIAQHS
jgi:hypothetical protein